MKDFKSVHAAVLALYSELLTLKKSMLNYIRSVEKSELQDTEGINANFQGIEPAFPRTPNEDSTLTASKAA